MKLFKWIKIIFLVIVIFTVTACNSTSKKIYVQAILETVFDANYKNYTKIYEKTEIEASNFHDEAIEEIANRFFQNYLSEELKERAYNTFEKVFEKVEYEVTSITAVGNDGHNISYAITPVDFTYDALPLVKKYSEEFKIRETNGEFTNISITEKYQIYYNGMLPILEKQINELKYSEKVIEEVKLSKFINDSLIISGYDIDDMINSGFKFEY